MTSGWVHAYLLVAAGTALILQRLVVARSVHRRQTAAVLLGVVAPWAGNVTLLAGVTRLGQVTGFVVGRTAVYWGISRYELVDLTPVARWSIVDAIDVGVVVLDDDRMIDTNELARSLLDGTEASTALSAFPEVVSALESDGSVGTTATTGDGRVLAVSASPLTDGDHETVIEQDRLDETTDALARIESIVDDVLTLAREDETVEETEVVSVRSAARRAWDHVVTDEARLIVATDLRIRADADRLQ